MQKSYRNLGIFSDIVDEARRQGSLHPLAPPGEETQRKVRETLGWCDLDEFPQEISLDGRWEQDGVQGEALSWSTGYGPRTQAWLFKPAGERGPLPGVLALHDHGGFKYYGKEKIAEGPDKPEPFLKLYRERSYGGRAWVNALAREGFAVLVHDTFLWGSRKFPVEIMRSELNLSVTDDVLAWASKEDLTPAAVAEYNYLAILHEHTVAKYLNLLGTSQAGVVCHEDRIALNYLRSRADILPGQVACMGLSGGGNRAGLLRATAQGLKAAVVVGMMSTYEGLLDHNVYSHTWMFYPYGWSRHGDWTDLVACQAPALLLVQYDREDALFTLEGMEAAHARLANHYRSVGHPEAYTGLFYPGPHKFDLEMQADAFNWLKTHLQSS